MDNYLFNLIVNVLLMGIVIISLKDLIVNKLPKKNLFRKINKVGWFIILIALLSIFFNFYKDYSADLKQEKSDKKNLIADSLLQFKQLEILELQNSIKDTIIKKVDSAFVKSIKASNEALAKYNLKITDSLNSVVSKLKLDAAKPQLVMLGSAKGKQPAFLTEVDGKHIFNIQFISKGGTSYNIRIKSYIIEDLSAKKYKLKNSTVLSSGETFLTEGMERTKMIEITPDILLLSNVIVLLNGNFSKDPEGKFMINYNEAFRFNFKENKFITGLELDFDKFKEGLKLN